MKQTIICIPIILLFVTSCATRPGGDSSARNNAETTPVASVPTQPVQPSADGSVSHPLPRLAEPPASLKAVKNSYSQ